MVYTETKSKRIEKFSPSGHLVEGEGFDTSTSLGCGDLLCVGKGSKTSSICLGDQGTPIQWTEQSRQKEYVVGVATIPTPKYTKVFGQVELCGNEVRATRVHSYFGWISKVLKNELCH